VFRIRLTLVLTTVLAAAGLPAAGLPAGAAAAEQWSPPVGGPVVRGYEPPRHPFGRRHLGLDYAAPPGTPVKAAGNGIVAFAGRVGSAASVAVEHPGNRRTTYAYLRRLDVRPGATVRRGQVLGLSGASGPRHEPGIVHFGYRVNGHPEDPKALFGGSRPRISLAPLDRPACPTLRPNPTPPGRTYSTRPRSIGVRRFGASSGADDHQTEERKPYLWLS
jgi:murein DD-endopeptidase MepM/ murein hydrolase activator NlpD